LIPEFWVLVHVGVTGGMDKRQREKTWFASGRPFRALI
jgi:hypothetical protein